MYILNNMDSKFNILSNPNEDVKAIREQYDLYKQVADVFMPNSFVEMESLIQAILDQHGGFRARLVFSVQKSCVNFYDSIKLKFSTDNKIFVLNTRNTQGYSRKLLKDFCSSLGVVLNEYS